MILARQQSEAERDWFRAFVADCRPIRLREMGLWAEEEVRLPSGPAEGRRFRQDRLPYARLLLAELGKWRRHVITGPTQSGKTLHAFVLVIMYYLFEKKEDVICGIPDLTMAGVKWQKDIKPVIEKSRYRDQIPKRGPGSQGGNPTLITFVNGKSLQFMAGGGNDKQRAGATAKIVIITETDGLDEVAATSKEGQDKVSQLEGRVRAFGEDARIFMECTVTTETGKTWAEYAAGTESRIACPCVDCGEYVTPEREDLVGWDGAATKLEAGEKAAFSCPKCGRLYSEAERRQMNLDAVLLHRGQEIDREGNITGDPPETDTLGFRWNAFNNLLTTARLIGMEEWQTERAEDPIAADLVMKQQVWCMPAKASNVERVPLTIGVVRGSAEGYHGRCNGRPMWEIPDGTLCLTAFVDVGLRVLNWGVNAHLPGNCRDVIAYGATPTEQPDVIGPEEAILSGLHTVRTILATNLERDLDVALVDCGYQGQKRGAQQKNPRRVVYEFILSSGGPWRASMGLSSWSNKEETDSIKPSLNRAPWYYSLQEYLDQSLWVVDFQPDTFKHLAHGGYLIRPTGNNGERPHGSVTLFGDDPKSHNEYATQLNNERFEVDHSTGKSQWVRHGANHYFDVDVGNIVARSVMESRLIEGQRNTIEATPPAPMETPDGRPFFVGNR